MNKEYQIESDSIKVTIKELGAEMISIYDKEKNAELLWNGDSKFWTGQAPIYFHL